MRVTVFKSSRCVTVRAEGHTVVAPTLQRALALLAQSCAGVQLGSGVSLVMEEKIARKKKVVAASRALYARGTAVIRVDPAIVRWVQTQALVGAIQLGGV